MTQEPNRANSDTTDTRNFLLSKAQSEPVNRTACRGETSGDDGLRRSYPQLLSGKSLVVRAMSLLEDVQEFAALAIQVDTCPSGAVSAGPESESGARAAVADALASVRRPDAGLWGLLDENTFGCYLPRGGPSTTTELVEDIKSKVLAGGGPTLTVGLALFPTLDYPKDKILDNARKALEHAKFFGPDSLVAFDGISLNISGDRLYDEGAYRAAIKEYETALKLEPSNANLHNSLGVCYGVTGAFEEALAQFDKALDLDADEALARYNAGLVHLLLGERERAREHLLEAEKRSQSLFEVKLQLGKLFLEDGRLAEGRSYLEAAADLQPHSSRVHCLLGECYAALDLQDQALAAYKKSLRINANDAASLSGLGWLYHAMGKNADIAKLFCRHSVEIAPRNGLFHHRLGCLFLKENRLTEAQGAFQTAEELGCDSASQLADVRSRLVEKAS